MGEIVEFPSNGGTASGYLATPEGGGGPPLVVIQEWWGLVPHITDLCDRFAAEGFAALAPDLYRGESTTEPDEAGKLMMALNVEQAAKDMSGAVEELRRVTGREAVGVTGFCMGGGLALVLACHRPDAIAACVPFYGLIPGPRPSPTGRRSRAAVLGHYAEQDDFFGPEQAAGLQQAAHRRRRRRRRPRAPRRRPRLLQRHPARGLRRRRVGEGVGRDLAFLRAQL